MTDRSGPSPNPSAFVAGLIVGGFVWIVFDSVALGILTGVTTLFLIKRDEVEEVKGEEEHS